MAKRQGAESGVLLYSTVGRASGYALLTVAGVYLAVGCEPNKPTSDEAGHATPATTCFFGGLEWPEQGEALYDLDMSSRVGVETGGSMVQFRLRSDLGLVARTLPGGTTQLATTLPNAQFEAANPDDKERFTRVAEELKVPFVFTLSRGRLVEVRARPDWSRFPDSISRALAAAFQVAERTDAGAETWTGLESDATGDYETQYSAPSTLSITKRKLRYKNTSLGTASFGPVNAKLTPEIVESEGRVTITGPDSAGSSPGRCLGTKLERLDYREKLTLPVSSMGGRVLSQTELKVAFKRRDAARPFDWDAAIAGTKAMTPSEALRTGSLEDAFDATRIGDYTFPKALQELEQAAKDPKASALAGTVRDVPVDPADAREREGLLREHGRVFTATAALLRAKPETIPLAVSAIRRNSPAATVLMDAL